MSKCRRTTSKFGFARAEASFTTQKAVTLICTRIASRRAVNDPSLPRVNRSEGDRRKCKSAMNLRNQLLLLLTLLVAISTRAQNPSPTGTPNVEGQEKGIAPIPVLTGGIALNSSFTSNEAALLPVVAPIILVPLGKHAVIETEFEAESEVVHTEGSW